MRTSESKIEQKACDLVLKYLGVVGSKLSVIGDTGYPDRVFWLPYGRPLLIEFKKPGEEPEPKQVEIHRRLRRLGYQVEVYDTAAEAFLSVINACDQLPLTPEQKKVLARARQAHRKLPNE